MGQTQSRWDGKEMKEWKLAFLLLMNLLVSWIFVVVVVNGRDTKLRYGERQKARFPQDLRLRPRAWRLQGQLHH